MTIKNRLKILMLGAFAGAILVPAYAAAQDAQSERLQRQIDALQRQLQSLQKQVIETKKASQEAAAARRSAASGAAYAQAAGPPPNAPWPTAARRKPTSGGIPAAECVFCHYNDLSHIGIPLYSLPSPIFP